MSLMTLARGAKQLVVQDALETTWIQLNKYSVSCQNVKRLNEGLKAKIDQYLLRPILELKIKLVSFGLI